MRGEGWCALGRSGLACLLVAGFVAACSSVPSPSPTRSPDQPGPSATASSKPTPTPTLSPDPASGRAACRPTEHRDWSVARRWDEALLDAIRRALPNPPVHARNLFHLSVAMWDAWATYDPVASGYLSHEKIVAARPQQARAEAISFAAWTVLKARFENANGAEDSLPEFDQLLRSLCYSPTAVRHPAEDSPAAVGDRIGHAVLAYGLTDGSNEANGYADPAYQPVNAPLVVASSKR